MTLASGSRLGPYEVVAPLGAGGMGEVYRARDRAAASAMIAIKVLPAEVASHVKSGSASASSRKPAPPRRLSNHPNIVTVHDEPRFRLALPVHRDGTGRWTGRCARVCSSSGRLSDAAVLGRGRAAGGWPREGPRGGHRSSRPEARERDGHEGRLRRGWWTSASRNCEAEGRPVDAASGSDNLFATLAARPPHGDGRRSWARPGYMSPEQARGEPAGHRANQFAVGASAVRAGDATSAAFRGKSFVPDAQCRHRAGTRGRSRRSTRTSRRRRAGSSSAVSKKDPSGSYASTHDLGAGPRERCKRPGRARPAAGPAAARPAAPAPATAGERAWLPWAVAAVAGGSGGRTVALSAGQAAPRRPRRPPSSGSPSRSRRASGFQIRRDRGPVTRSSPDGRKHRDRRGSASGRRRHLRCARSTRSRSRPLEGTDGAVSPFWSPGLAVVSGSSRTASSSRNGPGGRVRPGPSAEALVSRDACRAGAPSGHDPLRPDRAARAPASTSSTRPRAASRAAWSSPRTARRSHRRLAVSFCPTASRLPLSLARLRGRSRTAAGT